MPYAPNYYTTHKQTRWVRALFSTQNTETDEITHTKNTKLGYRRELSSRLLNATRDTHSTTSSQFFSSSAEQHHSFLSLHIFFAPTPLSP